MSLSTYAILHAVWKGHMPAEDAAESLGIPTKIVKTQVTYLGSRLEDIVQTLDDLTGREFASRYDLAAAKREVSKKLGVSVRQVNRFLSRAGLKPRPVKIVEREEASARASERAREHRLLAIDVVYGRKTLTEAANVADRHERTIRRVLDDLPIPVRYPDYDLLTPSTRFALGKNLEENRSCDHLATLVGAQINRKGMGLLPQTQAKPLLAMMIAWLEGETEQYDPGYEYFLGRYLLKGIELKFWEKQALADELRNLL